MKRWLILALTVVLGFAALFAIDSYYRYQIRQEYDQQLSAELKSVQLNLEAGIDQRILLAENLRAFMLASPTMPDSDTFDRYAALAFSHSPEVRALQYVDSDHIIRYIYPLEGNEEALNLDLMTRPAASFVEKAIQTRATVVNDPTVTVQDSLSIVVRSPLYDGDRYLGLVQSVVDIDSLLEEVSQTLNPQFAILLKDANGNIFWSTEPPVGNSLSSTVRVGDNRWELILGWAPPEPGPAPYVLGLIWGLGGALLLSVLFIINQSFQRMVWLSTAVEKKTAELAKSESRYRTLVETADDVILLTDLEGHHLFRNSAYYTSLGFKEGDDVELDGFARVHPSDEPLLQKKMDELLTGDTQSVEYQVRHREGYWVYRYARSKLIRDKEGNPQSILTIIRDITERKQAEREIEFQAYLLDTVEQAVMATDLEGMITYWNKFAEKLYGWSSDEVIGRNILEVTPAGTTREQAAEIMASMREGNTWSGEFLVQRKDGASFLAAITDTPVYDETGALVGIVGISSDITERKRQEQELLETKNLLEKTFASLTEVVLVVDSSDRTIAYCNPAVEQIFGYTVDELVGKSTAILHVDQESYDHFAQIGESVLEESGVFETEYEMRRSDGQIIITENTVTTLKERAGWTSGVVSVVRDITERKRLEEERVKLEKQFHQSQKMEAVGQLTAGIAHDLNNLVMAINGNAELMQMQLQPDGPLYRMTEAMLQAGERTVNLVRQLLIFSRKQIVSPEIVALNEVITELNRMLDPIVGENIEVRLNLAADLWLIKVDPAQIEQLVVNLVLNARDAMPDGGKLILETANVILDEADTAAHMELRPGEYVLLTVSDTGVGMSQEVQNRLFEPFFTTKEVGKGSGLGLATVYGIVKQNDGYISVYSEVEQGSTFKIYLPRTTEAVASSAADPAPKEVGRGRETILVVEDDDAIRMLARDVLSQHGYTVLEAENSQQALQFVSLHAGPIDLLLTDVIMPGMSGKALAKQLTERYPQLKVVYMSGYSDEVISNHGVLESGTVLLQKPFSFMDMVRKVQEMLG